MACFWRSRPPEPFEQDDVALAEELATRAAVSIDNARRYTREHAMAVTLQRSLLPASLPEQNALDVAYRHLPAHQSVGGDWSDVLGPLRTALRGATGDPEDDVALLVARTRVLPPEHVACWDVPAEPTAVGMIRTEVAGRLAEWRLAELGFSTELILSEPVTNAIRYADAPIGVRLLLDRKLVCEASDGSSTSPHLRYARATEEGGRGLFLVDQVAERWGTRYTAGGKVIWAEQPLPTGPADAASA